MSADRELLELAAKAAGHEFIYFPPYADGTQGEYLRVNGMENRWNPLTDDGDALRLAVKLDLLSGPEFWHERSVQYAMAAFSGDRQDPYAATRRAIVWAAAEIGKAIP